MPADTDYFLFRSRAEAVQSIAAQDPRAAAVHEQLCVLYAGRAIAGLVGSSAISDRRAKPNVPA